VFVLFFFSQWAMSMSFSFEATLSPRVSLNISSFYWSEFSVLQWRYNTQVVVATSREQTHGIDLSAQRIELGPPVSLNVDIAMYWSPSAAPTVTPWLYVANAWMGAFAVSRVGGSFWIKNLKQDTVVTLPLPDRPDFVFSVRQDNSTTIAFSHSFSSQSQTVFLSFENLPDYSLVPHGNTFSMGPQPGLVIFWAQLVLDTQYIWTYLDFPSVSVVPCSELPVPLDSPLFAPLSRGDTLPSIVAPLPTGALRMPMVFALDQTWDFGLVDIYFCRSYLQRFALWYQANSSRSLYPSVSLQQSRIQ